MKTGKYFTVIPILALWIAGASFNSFASNDDVKIHDATQNSNGNLNHSTLARQYDHLAKVMLNKVKEQEEILEHKPRTSFLGKNGQHIKSHIAYKIHRFEQAAQENFEKAAYHRVMAAEQGSPKSVTQSAQSENQINKVKIKSNKATDL